MSTRSGDLDCKVYVGELGSNATRHELEDAFKSYGPIRNVWVATNPPGFAFIMFEDSRDAKDACHALDGKTICGRRVRVEMSTGKTRHDGRGYGPPRGGGGGYGGYRGGGGSRGGYGGGGRGRDYNRDSRRDDYRDDYSRSSRRRYSRSRSRSGSPYRRSSGGGGGGSSSGHYRNGSGGGRPTTPPSRSHSPDSNSR